MGSGGTETLQRAAARLTEPGQRERTGALWSAVIDPEALDREVDVTGATSGREATSHEDEQRRQFLRRYAEWADGPGLYRREIVADEIIIARLRALKAEVPNGARVIAVVERAALLSQLTRSPLRVPPLIVLGPPGVGKSRLARRVADALGTALTVIDGGSTADPGPITGNAPSYRGSGPGRVVKALLDGATMSPVILFDEIEKCYGYHEGVKPLNALLSLMEPTTAKSFTDDYVGLSADASGVVWICTANSTVGLPSPLLDRAIVLTMPALRPVEIRRAVQHVLDEVLAECGLPVAALDGRALAALSRAGLREARRVLRLALAPALEAGRSAPNAADVAAARALVRAPMRRPRRSPCKLREAVGFVRFGV